MKTSIKRAKPVTLRLSGHHYEVLQRHLLPGDGCEAVAVALCGRHEGEHRDFLLVHQIELIPYDECYERTPDRIHWPTSRLLPLLERAAKQDLAILKIHSHPGNWPEFSQWDNDSDRDLFESTSGWVDSDKPHGSAVMMGNGRIFGRAVYPDQFFAPFQTIQVAGDDLLFWPGDGRKEYSDFGLSQDSRSIDVPEFARRHAQAFGKRTTRLLSRLSIGVVGCSGTGSPVIEQLARLGAGSLTLVDPDKIEEKNLNRIYNSTRLDAQQEAYKVDVAARAIDAMGLGTQVRALTLDIRNPRAVQALAECDLVIGCMDGVAGRHIMNRLCAFYVLPYFDAGVRLIADESGEIEKVCGSVNYLQPGGSSLLSRGVYSLEDVRAENQKWENPEEYERQLDEGYIRGVMEDRPAVISVNTMIAALTVNEILARIHPFRSVENQRYAWSCIDLTEQAITNKAEAEYSMCTVVARHVGRGDKQPLLDMPILSQPVQSSTSE